MIVLSELSEKDKGRNVVYLSGDKKQEVGQLTSWNDHFVFVRFHGPNGAACRPEDVSFEAAQ